MRQAPAVFLSDPERNELAALSAAAGTSDRLRRRVRVILEAATGKTNGEIAETLRVHPETVTRWRRRFAVNRLDGLRRDAPRSGSQARIPAALVDRIVRMTTSEAPLNGTRWTTRSLARALQVNHMLVHRVWKAHGLSPAARGDSGPPPDRPEAGLCVDVLGVFVGYPAAAIVFGVGPGSESIDEPAVHPRMDSDHSAGYLLSDRHASPAGLASLLAGVEASLPRIADARRSPHELLVFLRGLEEITDPTSALHVIFDRPLEFVSSRLAGWLRSHPRFRVLAVASSESWGSAVDEWIRTFRDVPLHAKSFRGIPALTEALREDRHPTHHRRFSWTLAPGLEVGPSSAPGSLLLRAVAPVPTGPKPPSMTAAPSLDG